MFIIDPKLNRKKLPEDEIQQIILKSLIPKYQQLISQRSFLKGWELRQNEFNKIYNYYSQNMTIRTIFNDYHYENNIVNKIIQKDMKQSVEFNECFIYFLSGATGSGKSWFSLFLAIVYCNITNKTGIFHLDPDDYTKSSYIYKKGNEEVDIYFSYSASNSVSIFKIAKEKSVIIQDESPKQHGKGSNITKDNLINIIKIAARRNNLNLIVINPRIIMIDNVNYYLRIIAKKRSDYSSLSLLYDSDMNPLGIVEFKVNIPEELSVEYNRLSKIQKERIKEGAGLSASTISEDQLRALALELIEQTRRFEIRNRAEMEQYAALVPSIAGHPFLKLICTEAMKIRSRNSLMQQAQERETQKNDQIPQLTSSEYSLEEFYQYAKKQIQETPESVMSGLDKKIMNYWIDGLSFSEISTMSDINMNPATIATRTRRYREGSTESKGSTFRLGKVFQDYISIKLLGKIYEHAYDTGADIVVNNEKIYTVKFEADNNKTYYIPSVNFAPEIKKAEELHLDKITLIYLNFISKPRAILTFEFDWIDTKKIIIDLRNNIKIE